MCYFKAVNEKVLSVVRELSFKFWKREYPQTHTHKNVSGEADFRAVGHMTWAFTGN